MHSFFQSVLNYTMIYFSLSIFHHETTCFVDYRTTTHVLMINHERIGKHAQWIVSQYHDKNVFLIQFLFDLHQVKRSLYA